MKPFAALAAMAVLLLSACGAKPATKDPPFSRAVVIVFENEEASSIVGNPDAPTFNSLARLGAFLPSYSAISHPSLPNYLALVSGSTHGIESDCTNCLVRARNLAGSLTAANRTWKTYAEGLPRPGWTGGYLGAYAKKHNPFLYFRSVLASPSQRRRVVPFSQLRADLAAGRLPDFSLVVPNLCHDIHSCPVAVGDRWLHRNLGPLLASPQMRNGVVFVLFDEGTTNTGGGGQVAAYAVGPVVQPGSTTKQKLTHYNVLATIEDALELPRLGDSAKADPITGIWRGGN